MVLDYISFCHNLTLITHHFNTDALNSTLFKNNLFQVDGRIHTQLLIKKGMQDNCVWQHDFLQDFVSEQVAFLQDFVSEQNALSELSGRAVRAFS